MYFNGLSVNPMRIYAIVGGRKVTLNLYEDFLFVG